MRKYFLNVMLIGLSTIFALTLFLLFDFFLGAKILNFQDKTISLEEKPYLQGANGWYELKSKFNGYDQFGPRIFPVETSTHGFRVKPGSLELDKYEMIFLGDSFTYGVNGPWEETFVGMFADETGLAVLNAGVGSYSPTAYLYQYDKFLKLNLLKSHHTLVLVLDISDVQDEAGIWIDGNPTPRYRDDDLKIKLQAFTEPSGLRKFFVERFPITRLIFRYVRHHFVYTKKNVIDQPRSAFTYAEWSKLDLKRAYMPPNEGYAPLGVEGGLVRVKEKIIQISKLAKKYDASFYILIYPWPAQLVYPSKFSWSSFVENLCTEISCSGVIDMIPIFADLVSDVKYSKKEFYVSGDVHFNENGNRVIANELLKRFEAKLETHKPPP